MRGALPCRVRATVDPGVLHHSTHLPVFGKEFSQVLRGDREGQVPHKEAPGLEQRGLHRCRVLLLLLRQLLRLGAGLVLGFAVIRFVLAFQLLI